MRLTMLFLLFAFLVSPTLSFAHGGSHGTYQRSSSHHSTGPNYGGGHHTVSHGGHYSGGSGSSHRGGHYVNPKTGNHYGHHKQGHKFRFGVYSFVTFKGGDFAKPAN